MSIYVDHAGIAPSLNLRSPDRIEREVHARYGAVDNVRRIDAWRDLALRFGPMGWRPEQKHEDAKQKYKTRETRHELLVAMVVTSMTRVVKIK